MARVVLISTYELGRQPFGLASPAAWLREAGVDVVCADLSRERFPQEPVRGATLVAFFLPMHTATRLALPVIDRVKRLNPTATLAAYGLYAPLNADLLGERGVHHVFGGEFEASLTELARTGAAAATNGRAPRLTFKVPSRSQLPMLTRYASLQVGDDRRTTGYTEASRGCKHRCRHCPVAAVYDGQFRIVAPDVVLQDVRMQVGMGASHITFGDPDFFNGIRHAREIIERFGREFPGVTFDVTVKIEHLLKHADMLPVLRDAGCAFVTSAVETLQDDVLERLEKGHTRADFERAAALCRDVRVALSPTFVTFTPWTTKESYLDLLRTLVRLELVEHVAPIQLAIRLLVTAKSRLLELEELRARLRSFDPVTLTYPWTHADPSVDRLQEQVARIVGVRMNAPRTEVFRRVWDAAHRAAGLVPPLEMPPLAARASVPYLTEPWYC